MALAKYTHVKLLPVEQYSCTLLWYQARDFYTAHFSSNAELQTCLYDDFFKLNVLISQQSKVLANKTLEEEAKKYLDSSDEELVLGSDGVWSQQRNASLIGCKRWTYSPK
ncbi:hypothetical protein QOT17_006961 [Balamuthia mandrillaris]